MSEKLVATVIICVSGLIGFLYITDIFPSGYLYLYHINVYHNMSSLHTNLPKILNRNLDVNRKNKSRKINSTILFWTFNYLSLMIGPEHTPRTWQFDCGPYQCTFTKNRRYLSESNGILFDTSFLKKNDMPETREPWQRWFAQTRESPLRHKMSQRLDNKVNMTFLYHHTADISWAWAFYIPYGQYHLLPFYIPKHHNVTHKLDAQMEDQKHLYKILLKSKTNQTLWYLSHCNVKRRDEYGRLLKQAGVKIDKFGKCGKPDPCKRKGRCLKEMFAKYKFYIAFENSYCEDYITEKAWKSLQGGMLPIVMGPSISNYDRMFPPDSFLHVENFSSVEDLASYINYLDNNDEAYMRYHLWREKYQIVALNDHRFLWICDLCKKVHDPTTPPYSNLSQWWTARTQCQT